MASPISPDWRIYYRGGATADSVTATPSTVPTDGVVNIVGYYPASGKRYIQHTWDFYHWHDGEWWGRDIWGVLRWAQDTGFVFDVVPDYPTAFHTVDGVFDLAGLIATMKRRGDLLEGVMVSNEEYQAIHLAAHHDPDFPIRG